MHSIIKTLLLLLLTAVSLQSCVDFGRSEPIHYTDYEPVLLSRESLEKSIQLLPERKITSPAKIYYKDNYIFISEKYKGVHVVNNTDPKNPDNEAFISVPGCVDMAIKENALYVDNAVDLAVIDLSDIKNSNIKITKRVRDAFPELATPDGYEVPVKFSKEERPKGAIIVEWIKK
jgi:hypothetical protein